MARRSLTFVLLGATFYVLAVATQVGWLYVFSAMLWSMGLVSALFAWHNLRGIDVSRRILTVHSARPETSLAGISEDDELEIGITVSNAGRLARYFLKLQELCPIEAPGSQGRSFFVTALSSKSSITVSYRARCYRRGEFSFPSLVVEASPPFGLMKRRQEFSAPLDLLVYPACYPMRRLPLGTGARGEFGAAVKVRSGSQFCGSREYRHGDPLRHIHWRNTARLAKFVVKEFEESERGVVAITFDAASDYGEGKETALEYSVKIAASVVRLCAAIGVGVHLLPGDGLSRVGGGPPSKTMEYLAKIGVGAETNLGELLSLPRVPYPVLAIVPLANSGLLPLLEGMARRTRHLVVVALVGFAEDEAGEGALGTLRASGADVLVCRRGELADTLEALQQKHLRGPALVGVGRGG